MSTLLKKELQALLYSPPIYVVISLMSLVCGLFLWVFPNAQTNIFVSNYASLQSLSYVMPWILMLGCSVLTMRSFSNEIKEGTLVLLQSSPVKLLHIVLAKYMANIGVIIIYISSTFIYILSINFLSLQGELNCSEISSCLLATLLLGITLISIGIFASSLSSSQILAFIVSLFLSFLLFSGLKNLSDMHGLGQLNQLLNEVALMTHYEDISGGFLRLESFVYIATINYFFIFSSYAALSIRREV